ncbi:hypothetical protein FHX44_11143 [Pseudonocardia hierapolitana]|uniref:Uncharacterized protein n=1 Tax=Pseudonocardia hierapolitana TaxID=1128676 RepID=A0A561SHC8_9PSEU|nr:hypothetical protein FHX44_11143 [Pseudonocardia hierapolitana]
MRPWRWCRRGSTPAPSTRMRPAATHFQSYELMFWNTLADA